MKNRYSTISEIQEDAGTRLYTELSDDMISIKCLHDGMYYFYAQVKGNWELKATSLTNEYFEG